ncbi:MAG: hypothetical protein KAQ62_10190 [Cyclobacteriaceae bacterium]|nr:hypothetical protein [Cyclobacteriaceae bacterium]
MSKSEFLLLIPGLIYGVGVVDLIKVTFRLQYWEIYIWASILFLVLILQWYSLYNTMDQTINSKLSFTLMMISPLVFTRGCYLFTPDEDTDTKEYFLKCRKVFFVNMILMILINSGLQLFIIAESDNRMFSRFLFLPLMIIACYWDNKWYRLSIALLFFIAYAQYFI